MDVDVDAEGMSEGMSEGISDWISTCVDAANGQPLPVVGQVLELFSEVPSRVDWDNAIWFVAANGWLGGRMPYELLTNAPQKVKHAAEQEVLPDIE